MSTSTGAMQARRHRPAPKWTAAMAIALQAGRCRPAPKWAAAMALAMQARRRRPAPKWAAAMALAFTLAGGEAAAQLTPDGTFDGNGLKVDAAAAMVEGASATITVTLKAGVAANTASATLVTVTVLVEPHGQHGATAESTDVVLNPGTATLSFPANATGSAVTHEISGTVPLQTIDDPDAEDEAIVLAIGASGGGLSIGDEPRHTIALDDDETQSYVVALAAGATPREGAAPFGVTVSAEPAHVDGSKTLTLQLDDTEYSLDTDGVTPGDQMSGTLDGATPSFTAEVTPPGNDGDRMADTLTITAYSGTVGNATQEASHTFTVADAHALPAPAAVTVEASDGAGMAVTSVAEGGAVELTVSVDRGRGATATTGEALSVALSLAPTDPAQASTYRLEPDRVDLPAVAPPDGRQSATTVVRLEALPDEFVDDDRLTLSLVTTGEAAYGAGSVESTFDIDVRDTTVRKIAPRPDSAVKQAFDAAAAAVAGADGLNPGEVFTVAVSELFEGIAPGSTVAYSAFSSDPSVQASASSTEVTVTPVSAGSAAVRVIARVTDAAAAVPQTRADEAAVEHVVTVGAAVTYTLSGPAGGDLVEGRSYTLRVTADPASSTGATFAIRHDPAASTADAADFTLEPASIVLSAGATEGTTMLTVADDGVDEGPEALVLVGVAPAGTEVGPLALTLRDATPVPVLPVAAQLLLAALLALGGYRRYRRR